MDADLLRYLPLMLPLGYQGMIQAARTKKFKADLTFKDFQTLKFNIKLFANQYMIWKCVHICLPIKITEYFFMQKLMLSATEIIYKFYQQII